MMLYILLFYLFVIGPTIVLSQTESQSCDADSDDVVLPRGNRLDLQGHTVGLTLFEYFRSQ
jgi:hypothetical protein